MSIRLFYDKFAGHHGIGTVVDAVDVDALDDGSYTLYIGENANSFLKSKFGNKKDLDFNNEYFQIIPAIQQSFYKLFVYQKIINNIEAVLTVIEINLNALNIFMDNKWEVPHRQFLYNTCKWHQFYIDAEKRKNEKYFSDLIPKEQKIVNSINYIVEKSKIPHDYTHDLKIANFDKLIFPLFEYQKATIRWMINREQNLPTFYYSDDKEVALGNNYLPIMATAQNQKIRRHNERNIATFNGGGLFDEVGLGKTIQMIVLSLLNPKVITDIYKKPVTTLLESKATLVLCPNNLCGQWVREISSKLKDTEYRVTIINEAKSKSSKTNADANVSDETQKQEIKIIRLLTKVDYDKITYQDLLNADFVIVSFTFITGTVYFQRIATLLKEKKNFHSRHWEGILLAQIIKLMTDTLVGPAQLKDTNVLLQKIFWHRIIIDEFHEVHTNKNYVAIVNLMRLMHSTYRWIVTATPFNDVNNVGPFINFLTNYQDPKPCNMLIVPDILNFVATECFRGITRKAVDTIEAARLPPLIEEIKWLNFSTTERLMYDAYLQNHNNFGDDVYLRQLCCHPQLAEETKLLLSNCKTLDEIEVLMVKHYRNDMLAAKKVVDGTQGQINKVDNLILYVTKKVKINKIKRLYNYQKKSARKINKEDVIIIEDLISLLKSSEEDEILELINEENPEAGEAQEDLRAADQEKLDAVSMEIIDPVLTKLITNNPNYDDKTKPSATIENLEARKKELIKRQSGEKDILNGKQNTLNFFTSIVDKLKRVSQKTKNYEKEAAYEAMMKSGNINDLVNEICEDDVEDECLICMAEITREDIGVTMCGHMFCYKCLTKSIEKSGTCPMCKKNLTRDKYFTVAAKVEKKEYNESDCKTLSELTQKIGTKLANLVMMLKNTEKHTIVFSQWPELLTKIGRILSEHGVPNIFCKGTVFRKDKCIRDFNEKNDIKVIMLSSGNTASGTNLTKATQIIFVDPAYGTYEYRVDLEKQAIGRAYRTGQTKPVTVIRLIIKDSIEEQIYHSNKERKDNSAPVTSIIPTPLLQDAQIQIDQNEDFVADIDTNAETQANIPTVHCELN
jgi:SNF2 family DNA or RNA helicase